MYCKSLHSENRAYIFIIANAKIAYFCFPKNIFCNIHQIFFPKNFIIPFLYIIFAVTNQ